MPHFADTPKWLKITAVVECAVTSRTSDALDRYGALAITITNATKNLFPDESTSQQEYWALQAVSGLFEDSKDCTELTAILREISGPQTTITISRFIDRDWVAESEAHFKPIQITPFLWVCPNWHLPPDPDSVTIRITPGLAFGTGKHPSTALCLTHLAESPVAGKTVLDWGCGSGILAIAAAKLGAIKVIGVDIDHRALAASYENAINNAVADQLLFCRQEEISHGLQFQLIMANVLANTLIDLAETLNHYLARDGQLLLSGILDSQAEAVVTAYGAEFNFEIVSREGWSMIIATKCYNKS